jgi:prepilin-type N-terminal cleavage/methylation domain-containing protein
MNSRSTQWPLDGTGPRLAFTLIELLVVFSIIAVLASLLVGLAGVSVRKGREGRVRTELQQLVTAIEKYKSVHGQYPPDNVVTPNPATGNPVVDPLKNPLYYELVGVVVNNTGGGSFQVPGNAGNITPLTVRNWFNRDGFLHAAADRKELVSYLTVKPSQVKPLRPPNSTAPAPEVLVVPVDAPKDSLPYGTTNPWRYVSTSPTNNPNSFDLWAEFYSGKNRIIIGNW